MSEWIRVSRSPVGAFPFDTFLVNTDHVIHIAGLTHGSSLWFDTGEKVSVEESVDELAQLLEIHRGVPSR